MTAPTTPLLDVALGPNQTSVDFSADGQVVTATGRDRVSVWDVPRRRTLLSLRQRGADVRGAIARARERVRLQKGTLNVKVSRGRARAVAHMPVVVA